VNGGARRALAFAAAALLASGLASCVDDHSSRTTDPPATAPATQTAVSDPTPTQDPGPSVGPRTEALRNADILVFSK
jgi:hypothetical protein